MQDYSVEKRRTGKYGLTTGLSRMSKILTTIRPNYFKQLQMAQAACFTIIAASLLLLYELDEPKKTENQMDDGMD